MDFSYDCGAEQPDDSDEEGIELLASYSSDSDMEEEDDEDSELVSDDAPLPPPAPEVSEEVIGEFVWTAVPPSDDLLKSRRFSGLANGNLVKGLTNLPGISASEWFFAFLPETFWQDVVTNSNSASGQPDITLAGLYRYLAVLVNRSLFGDVPLACLWDTNPLRRVSNIGNVVKRSEWKLVSRVLHISSRSEEEDTRSDKFFKVRPMIDVLLRNCMANFDPGCDVAYDEATIGYSGRTDLIVRTKHKKVPSGLQAWCLCDSETSYVWWFEFCKDTLAHQGDLPGLSKTHAALYRASQALVSGNWHIIYLDNLFTTPKMARLLLGEKCLLVGTWRTSNGMPKYLQRPKLAGRKLEEARTEPVRVMVAREVVAGGGRAGGGGGPENPPKPPTQGPAVIAGISTYCSNALHMITTASFSFSDKELGGTRNKLKYAIQHAYNSRMNGVDKHDQAVARWGTYVRTLKWWKAAFHWLLDVAINNSFRCYSDACGQEAVSMMQFRTELVQDLLQRASALDLATSPNDRSCPSVTKVLPGKRRLSMNNTLDHVRLAHDHCQELTSTRQVCAVCWFRFRKRHTTHQRCRNCDKYICEDQWHAWHTMKTLTKAKKQ